MTTGFFLAAVAEAKDQDRTCQFTLNIPNLNVYPLNNRLKGDGTAFQGRQAFWLLDPWFVDNTANKVRGCLDNLYRECVKAFAKSAFSEAHLKAQCTRAAEWRVTDSFNATAGDNNKNWTTYLKKKPKLVKSAECLSGTSGKDTGKLGCRNITFRPNIKIGLIFGHVKLLR